MACNNLSKCACTYLGCEHHGKCCECIQYHKRLGEAPGCLFSAEAERSYDRSIERLFSDYKKGH